MPYGIYCGLIVLSFIAMMGSRMSASRFTLMMAILIGLAQLFLIGCAFWQYGWKQGVMSILAVIILLIVTEAIAGVLKGK